MSSASQHRRLAFRALAPALLALALGACTMQPLYGPAPSGNAVVAELAAISIPPVGDRVGQQLRNDLIFAFTGGSGAASPLYELRFSTAVTEQGLGIDPAGTSPVYAVRLLVRYTLVNLATNKPVTTGTALGVADYDRSNQAFANVRARRDAEDRAAASAADQMRLAISATLARSG